MRFLFQGPLCQDPADENAGATDVFRIQPPRPTREPQVDPEGFRQFAQQAIQVDRAPNLAQATGIQDQPQASAPAEDLAQTERQLRGQEVGRDQAQFDQSMGIRSWYDINSGSYIGDGRVDIEGLSQATPGSGGAGGPQAQLQIGETIRQPVDPDLRARIEAAGEMANDARRRALGGSLDQLEHAGNILNNLGTEMNLIEQQFEMAQAEAQRRVQDQMNDLQTSLTALRGMRIDPQRFFAQRGDGARFGTSVAIALGTLAQGFNPQAPNTALQIVNSAIERDIQAQQVDLQNQQAVTQGQFQLLGALRNYFSDQQSSLLALKAMRQEQAKLQLEQMATRYAQPQLMAQYDQLRAALDMQQATTLAELQQREHEIQLGYVLRGSPEQIQRQAAMLREDASSAAMVAQGQQEQIRSGQPGLQMPDTDTRMQAGRSSARQQPRQTRRDVAPVRPGQQANLVNVVTPDENGNPVPLVIDAPRGSEAERQQITQAIEYMRSQGYDLDGYVLGTQPDPNNPTRATAQLVRTEVQPLTREDQQRRQNLANYSTNIEGGWSVTIPGGAVDTPERRALVEDRIMAYNRALTGVRRLIRAGQAGRSWAQAAENDVSINGLVGPLNTIQTGTQSALQAPEIELVREGLGNPNNVIQLSNTNTLRRLRALQLDLEDDLRFYVQSKGGTITGGGTQTGQAESMPQEQQSRPVNAAQGLGPAIGGAMLGPIGAAGGALIGSALSE